MTSNLPDPEALLQHREFLRGLARQLLGDEHLAEDVVQESYIAALTTPPRSAEAMRSWLARVVTRRASNRRRGESRRRQREHEGASGEALPSTHEVSESLHAQRRVLAALDGLPAAQKTAIYLRWYEGLPPREIARRMEVPVETVRSRIKRGLARLRSELDEEFGDRESWALVLLPLARVERTGSGLGLGALLGAAALLAVGAVAWKLNPREVRPNALQPAEMIRELNAGAAELPGTGDLRRSALELAEGEGHFETQDVLADQAEATAATVLDEAPLSDLRGPSFELDLALPAHLDALSLTAELLTMEQGVGSVGPHAAVRPGALPWVAFPPPPALSLTRTGGHGARILRVISADRRFAGTAQVHAIDGLYPVPVSVALEPCGGVEFRLLDESGEPVVGALLSLSSSEVGAFDVEAHSDIEGVAKFRALLPGAWQLEVNSSAHAAVERSCDLLGGESTRVELKLETLPTMRVAGQVWSRSGGGEWFDALRLQRVDDTAEAYFATPRSDGEAPGSMSFDFGEVPSAAYVLLPPVESPFAWDPPFLELETTDLAARLECVDGKPTRDIRVRAFDSETGERIESFRATLLVDRYNAGVRRAVELEQQLRPREASFDSTPWPAFDIDLPAIWLIEADGYLAAQGDQRNLLLDGEQWLLEVQLAPAWSATFWAGTLDEKGWRQPIEGVRLLTATGQELGRTLSDGLLYLEFNYDPGRLQLDADGWQLLEWEGFTRGRPSADLELYEIWFEAEN